jgi:hypothetical protein
MIKTTNGSVHTLKVLVRAIITVVCIVGSAIALDGYRTLNETAIDVAIIKTQQEMLIKDYDDHKTWAEKKFEKLEHENK